MAFVGPWELAMFLVVVFAILIYEYFTNGKFRTYVLTMWEDISGEEKVRAHLKTSWERLDNGKIEIGRGSKKELERYLELLDKRFIEGEVSEETYKELKSKLKMKLTQMTDAHVSRKDHQTVDEDTKEW